MVIVSPLVETVGENVNVTFCPTAGLAGLAVIVKVPPPPPPVLTTTVVLPATEAPPAVPVAVTVNVPAAV